MDSIRATGGAFPRRFPSALLPMSGFPPELRPLLAIVIVLAIVHMLLKARARSAKARTRRTRARATRRPQEFLHASGVGGGSGAAATDEPDPSIEARDAARSVGETDSAATDPAAALRELRARAAGAPSRSKDSTT